MSTVSDTPETDASEPQHQDRPAEFPEGWDFSSLNALTREGPVRLKILKLAVRGTPVQIASVIANLSNKVAETEGYLPFYFGYLGFRDIPIKSTFAVDTDKIDNIMVRSADYGQAIPDGQPLTWGTKTVGRMSILSRPRDKGADTSCLEFTCHEPDCDAFKERLDQLVSELRNFGYSVVSYSDEFLEDGCTDLAASTRPEISPEGGWANLVADMGAQPDDSVIPELVLANPQDQVKSLEQQPKGPRRKSGRHYPPIQDMLEIVLCFERVRGIQSQNVYVKRFHISVSTFKRWRTELQLRGFVEVADNGVTSPADGAEFDPDSDCP